MSITFCVEAHNEAEDDALPSEKAPTLTVHNTGGWTRLAVLGIEPDHYGTIDAADLLARAAGMKQKALAAALNRPLSWVRAHLALVGLPTTVQEAIDAGSSEPSDALTFAKYADRPAVIDAVVADDDRLAATRDDERPMR
jgi:hypothetical protein